MTFHEMLQIYEGELIRISEVAREGNVLKGNIGMICDVTLTPATYNAWVILFIDGRTSCVLLFENEVEFL